MPVDSDSIGRFSATVRTYVLLGALLAAVAASPALTSSAAATERQALVIETEKPLGPSVGSFSTSGAFVDSGELVTEERLVSAVPSPFGVVSHLVLRFDGQQGSFRIRTQIIETVTNDPNIFADVGTWVIVDGTGAYATLLGTGDVEGTVDDVTNLVTRVFTGRVHFR